MILFPGEGKYSCGGMDFPGRSRSKTYQSLAHGQIGGPALAGMKPVQKRDTQLKQGSKIRTQITKSETCGRISRTLAHSLIMSESLLV